MEIDVPMPEANISLIEDYYPVPVSHVGHGTQHSFLRCYNILLQQNKAKSKKKRHLAH